MKQTTITCDVEHTEHEGDVAEGLNMMMVFNTETTEGRNVTPYLTHEKIDICHKCLSRIVHEYTLLSGYGAQGYNHYYFKGDRNA